MKDRHRGYLEAMGIQLWKHRHPPESVKPGETADQPEPLERAELPEPPSPLPAPPPEPAGPNLPGPGPGTPPHQSPPLADNPDIPAEYAQWAMATDDREDPDFDLELDPVAGASEEASRASAIARMDWEALGAAVLTCTACELHKTRTQGVFGVGDRHAQWMIIGEAPGADEDRLGEPFVGRAGKLLDAMLFALGLRRKQVFIANILKSRPPNNRDPRPEEVQACWPYLQRQIELVGPRVILVVGRIAAQSLLHTDTAIGRLRGRVHRFGDRGTPVVVTYHPAYLLRSPTQKRRAWEDLQLARRTLSDELGRSAEVKSP